MENLLFLGVPILKHIRVLHDYRFLIVYRTRVSIIHTFDGWMTCDFTSFLTVFQSYQDDDWMIIKGCVQWNSVYG